MMMKRLFLTLLALVLAAVAALAGDTVGGGEGGAINLPGGRNGSGMQSNGGGSEWIVGAKTDLRLRLSPDMVKAIVVLRSMDLPFVQTLAPVDGLITVTLATILRLRDAQEPGFTLDIVTVDGAFLHVTVEFVSGGDLRVIAR